MHASMQHTGTQRAVVPFSLVHEVPRGLIHQAACRQVHARSGSHRSSWGMHACTYRMDGIECYRVGTRLRRKCHPPKHPHACTWREQAPSAKLLPGVPAVPRTAARATPVTLTAGCSWRSLISSLRGTEWQAWKHGSPAVLTSSSALLAFIHVLASAGGNAPSPRSALVGRLAWHERAAAHSFKAGA